MCFQPFVQGSNFYLAYECPSFLGHETTVAVLTIKKMQPVSIYD